MSIYKINEVFESLQGEGSFTGLPSIFVRLQGCPVGCPWCDTQHTWSINPDKESSAEEVMAQNFESESWFSQSPEQLLALFSRSNYVAKHVVITGGEPCLYDLLPITSLLIEKGFSVQIETSGTYKILAHDDTWVTVSPKVDMPGKKPVLEEAVKRANEIKHPVAMEKHIEELDKVLAMLPEGTQPLVYLQPISQQARATQLAIKTCIARNWRLSLQTHKYLGIE